MEKLNKWEKTFKELGVDLSSYKPTATQELPKYYSYKEVFNSPAYKKWVKKMEEEYEAYYIDVRDAIIFAYGLHHKQNLAKPIKLPPSRVAGKKKGKKR